jgi:AraC-like DNA-binding protein
MKAAMAQKAVSFEQRVDRLVEGFLNEASRRPSGRELARWADYSVAQTHRIFRSAYGEAPGAFRRRLVLERAADLLVRTDASVWRIAVDSGFASAEAFSRAFRRSFNTTPRDFRKSPTYGWIPAPNRIHYWRGSLLRSMATGETKMNLTDRLVEHDIADTRALLERAQTLTARQLDAKIDDPQPRLFLECYDASIRGRLSYLITTKECWLAAVYARPNPLEGERDDSPKGMLARWATVEKEWRDLVKSVEAEGRWDEMFIDALCEQPETFSFGGMIAHVLDQSARNRTEAFRAFAALGHTDAAFGDPLTWEMRIRD